MLVSSHSLLVGLGSGCCVDVLGSIRWAIVEVEVLIFYDMCILKAGLSSSGSS